MGLRFLVFFVLLCSCRENILHSLPERKANQVKVVLAEYQIESWKREKAGFWNIAVRKENASKALSLLEESRLLVKDVHRVPKEIAGIVKSSEQRAYQLERMTAWDLEETLEAVPGVVQARVHLDKKSKSKLPVLKEDKSVSFSSVFLVLRKKLELTDLEIKQVISGALGINLDSILVVKVYQKMPELVPVESTKRKGNAMLLALLVFSSLLFILLFFLGRKKISRGEIF